MFTGCYVAIITPFTSDSEIDYSVLKSLIDYHVAAGTTGIVAVGTTGECATLTFEEHVEVVRKTVEYVAGRLPVIAGTGSNSTSEAVRLTKAMEELNVDACLTVTPYYNKPSQEGLYHHFKTIAESTDLPQILYNVPGRTGVDLLPDTVGLLSALPNIVSIKDATSDMSRISATKLLCKEGFSQLSGDDSTAYNFMKLGGNGVVSVTANVVAREMAKMVKLALDNKFDEAFIIEQKLHTLHKALFAESNPIGVKWAAEHKGLITSGLLRLPLTQLSTQYHKQIIDSLKAIN